MPRLSLLTLLLLCAARPVEAQSLTETDHVLLTESYRLFETLQDSVWHGLSNAPDAVLLITPDYEFLLHHPNPPDDFREAGFDASLQSDIFVRARQFNPSFLATFPVNGTPTIVIGRPEATGKRPSEWLITMLHEHFHQWQTSRPDYYEHVATLDLAGDDKSGMWMLNYPFPYDDPGVMRAVKTMSQKALAALQARQSPDFSAKLTAYRAARAQLKDILDPSDYRYLSFQLWQEGVARYVEYRAAKAAGDYIPTPAFQALAGYLPPAVLHDTLSAHFHAELEALTLDTHQRIAFYPLGAAEALLLDAAQPAWRGRYRSEPFYLERYFEER